MIEYEALNPVLYAKVLDDLECIPSHKPFQILFYGSRERGDYDELSDLNFYLLANSTDQMKQSFIEAVSAALHQLESIAPVTMIAGDADSIRLRMKIHEPGSVQLLENASIFYGENIWETLQNEWKVIKTKDISRLELSNYLEKRIRFFKQHVSKNIKDEISQLERICTLTIHLWAIQNINDISLTEVLVMDSPSQINPLFKNLYRNEMDESIMDYLEIQKKLHSMKRNSRWKKDINREELLEIKYKLMSHRKNEEFLLKR